MAAPTPSPDANPPLSEKGTQPARPGRQEVIVRETGNDERFRSSDMDGAGFPARQRHSRLPGRGQAVSLPFNFERNSGPEFEDQKASSAASI